MNRQREADLELTDLLCEIEEGLTDWEVGFVESIAHWMSGINTRLTDDQRTKAQEILARSEMRHGNS